MHGQGDSGRRGKHTHGNSDVGHTAVALLETLDVLTDFDSDSHGLMARDELCRADVRAEPPTKGSSTYWELSNEFTVVDVSVRLLKGINSSHARSSNMDRTKRWVRTPHMPQ